MGVTATVNALRNWVLLLSYDYVLKFDWYCQLSGSRSNSLNSQKLPGRFSYRPGNEASLVVGCCYVDAHFKLCTTDLDQQVEADPSLLEKYLRGEESPRSHIHGGEEGPGPHIHSHSSYSSVVITRRPDGVRALSGIFHSS